MNMKRTVRLFGLFLWNIFAAPITLAKIATKVYNKNSEKLPPSSSSIYWPYALVFVPLFATCIFFCILQIMFKSAWAISLFIYLCFCATVAAVRMQTRQKLNISGHVVEDFLCSVILYPSVVAQMEMTLDSRVEKDRNTKSDIFDAPI